MYSGLDTLAGGFPHSEICGSKLVCQLPAAFRRLPRPSSPVIAKASTVCAWSLDPATPKHLVGVACRLPLPRYVPPWHISSLRRKIIPSALLHRTFQIVKEQATQRLCAEPLINSMFPIRSHHPCGGARRVRTADPRLAKPMLSQLSYGPRLGGGSGWTRTTDLTLIRGAL